MASFEDHIDNSASDLSDDEDDEDYVPGKTKFVGTEFYHSSESDDASSDGELSDDADDGDTKPLTPPPPPRSERRPTAVRAQQIIATAAAQVMSNAAPATKKKKKQQKKTTATRAVPEQAPAAKRVMSATSDISSTASIVHRTTVKVGGNGAAAPQAHASDPVEDFFKMMLKLLETLTDVFDECPACARDFQELKTTEANGNRDYKERMVKTWYAQIKPHITEVTRRNNDVILRDLVPFLQRLNLRAKWLDPDLDDEDRGHLWSYINQLTYLSCLHCEVDPKQVQALHTMSCRVQDIFKVSDEHIMSFDIRSLGELAQEVKRIGPQLAPMMKQLVTPGGNSGLQSMISAQVNNFASQAMKQLQQPGPAPSAAVAEAGISPTYSTSQLQRHSPEEVD